MLEMLGLVFGLLLTAVAVAVHATRGAGWRPGEDISQDVLEQRAATVPETDFPEPANRTLSAGGGAGAAAAVQGGDADGELEEGEAEAASSPADVEEVEHYDVEFVKEGETIEVSNDAPLLDQGEDEGWDLPYACREGQCVSCAGHIPDGDARDFVEHDDQEMLDDPELEDGYVLTCVAYPRGEFSIETNEAP